MTSLTTSKFLTNLTPENTGQIVLPLEKSEIKEAVVLVGHLEPRKPWVTELALHLQAKSQEISQLKTCCHVVMAVATAVTEDSQEQLGNTGSTRVLFLEVSMAVMKAVNRMTSLHVNTILKDLDLLVEASFILQSVYTCVRKVTMSLTIRTRFTGRRLMLSPNELIRSSMKSWPMGLSRQTSQSSLTSPTTSLESTSDTLSCQWEDMQSEFLDGELRTKYPIGWLPTLGTQTGETKVCSLDCLTTVQI